MERKENYWKNIFKDHLSYIKCLPGLETKSTFRLGLFSVGGGKSLMVLWYINIYIFLCEWERKQESSVDHSMERHAINLKISIFIHSSHWCCLPGCSLGLQVFPFWSALSWNEVIEICSEHIKSRWNQTVNICSQQEQLNRALKLDVPSWELICCWDGFLPASLLLWGYCRCKNSLTCWIEPFYQYHFQMLTAVSPVQRHGWLVNKNSPKNSNAEQHFDNNLKGSGLVACAPHQEMNCKPAACKFRWGFALRTGLLCCLIFSVSEPPDQKWFMECKYHLADVTPFPRVLSITRTICQSPRAAFCILN